MALMQAGECSAPVQHGAPQLQNHEHDMFLDEFCKNQLPALLLSSTNGRQRNILPVKRVKAIMKQAGMQPNRRVSSAADDVMAFGMQAFIRSLMAVAWKFAVARKRRTVQVQDLESAVFAVRRFSFLVDLLHTYDNEHDPNGPALPAIAPALPIGLPMP